MIDGRIAFGAALALGLAACQGPRVFTAETIGAYPLPPADDVAPPSAIAIAPPAPPLAPAVERDFPAAAPAYGVDTAQPEPAPFAVEADPFVPEPAYAIDAGAPEPVALYRIEEAGTALDAALPYGGEIETSALEPPVPPGDVAAQAYDDFGATSLAPDPEPIAVADPVFALEPEAPLPVEIGEPVAAALPLDPAPPALPAPPREPAAAFVPLPQPGLAGYGEAF